MTVIVCVSDGGGMTFAKRRLSRDRAVTEDIVKISGDGALFVSEYSESLFSESDVSLIVASNPLASAGCGDFVFVEDRGLSEHKKKIDALVIYRWNRKYPFDLKLDLEPTAEGMILSEMSEFAGNSHEKITREIWRKK